MVCSANSSSVRPGSNPASSGLSNENMVTCHFAHENNYTVKNIFSGTAWGDNGLKKHTLIVSRPKNRLRQVWVSVRDTCFLIIKKSTDTCFDIFHFFVVASVSK